MSISFSFVNKFKDGNSGLSALTRPLGCSRRSARTRPSHLQPWLVTNVSVSRHNVGDSDRSQPGTDWLASSLLPLSEPRECLLHSPLTPAGPRAVTPALSAHGAPRAVAGPASLTSWVTCATVQTADPSDGTLRPLTPGGERQARTPSLGEKAGLSSLLCVRIT